MAECQRSLFLGLCLAISLAPAAFGQQAQIDPKYLLGPLQAQRDNAANQAAVCSADNARLNEELVGLKQKLAELEAKVAKPDTKP